MELNVRVIFIFVDLVLLISKHLSQLPLFVSSHCFHAVSFRMRYTNISEGKKPQNNLLNNLVTMRASQTSSKAIALPMLLLVSKQIRTFITSHSPTFVGRSNQRNAPPSTRFTLNSGPTLTTSSRRYTAAAVANNSRWSWRPDEGERVFCGWS